MTYEQYMEERLGKTTAQAVEKAGKEGRVIYITGKPATGKTTVANLLRRRGYTVVEDFEVYWLDMKCPLPEITQEFISTIS